MPTLSSLLVQRSVASMQAVEDAIARQVLYGDDLATNVLEVGAAREDDVTRLAAESIGMFPLPPGKILLLEATVLRLLPGDVAQRYGIFPIEKRGSDLVVATSEPLSQNVEEDLGFLLNLNLRPVYALHVRIMQALADHYGQPVERRYKRLLAKLEGRKSHDSMPPAAGSPAHDASGPRAATPARTPSVPARPLEAPTRTIAQERAEPAIVAVTAAGVPDLMPQRPTLRGLPAVTAAASPDESWGPAPDNAASALPETIDLSPRPSSASMGASFAAQVATLSASASSPASRPAARSLTPSEAAPTLSAPPVDPPIAAEAHAHVEGVPQALASWARPSSADERAVEAEARRGASPGSPADARKGGAGAARGPARARRKGPFPAGLAEEEMQSAVNTDAVLEVFFDFAQQYFEYAALFVVHGDIAEGRDASGRGADRASVAAVGLPLDLPSTLAGARDRRVPVVADFATEGLDAELLQDLGRAPAVPGVTASPTAPSHRAAAVVIPVVVRGRAVALLFGDDSPIPVELASIGDVIAFAALAGASIERIIVRRKMGRSGSARLTPAAAGPIALRTEGLAPMRATPVAAPAEPPGVDAAAEPAPPVAKASEPPAPRAAPPRGGLAALARMFGAPAVRAQAAPPPAGISLPPGLVAVRESSPPDPFRGGALAAAVSETMTSGDSVSAEPVPAASPDVADGSSEITADADAAGARADEQQTSEAWRANEPFELTPSAATPGDGASFAVAMQTPPFEEVDVVATPAPDALSASLDGGDTWGADPAQLAPEQLSDSGSDALTVALLVPVATPSPREDVEPLAPEAEPVEPEVLQENETQAIPDDALETVEPAAVELSVPIDVDVEPSVPLDVASEPAEVEPSVPLDVASEPAEVEPSVPLDVEPSVPLDVVASEPADVDSNAETAAPPVHFRPQYRPELTSGRGSSQGNRPSTTGDRPSSTGDRPSSSDGRPSAPLVVDVFADSTGGLANAIARAAEEASAREVLRAAEQESAAQAKAAEGPPPPEETLTEGFPGAAPDPAHLSPETPGPIPLDDDRTAVGGVIAPAPLPVDAADASAPPWNPAATPSVSEAAASPPANDVGASAWARVNLDVLLARAVRGPESADARAELNRRADRNLAPLLALFPGPLDQDRHRSAERLPAASQCGPLLDAFAHAGARGAATVAVLARHEDVDVRFWAAHLLGEIASPEAADGLLPFLVDPDAAVRRIALRSAGLLLAAGLPGRPLEAALGYLARDAQTPMRERSAAIDAMGQLRVPFFVPVLIGLLGAVPDEVGETARRSLLMLTRQDFARDAPRWSEWWSRNDARHRIEWLVDALMHDTQSLRRAAGDELKNLTKEYFGYYDDLPRRERERAQDRYREWWEREGRARFK
jgi:hypothetical protein